MYLHDDKEQFREALSLAAHQSGIVPAVVEKDYYVTMILRLLREHVPFIVFKGGTSLSKCFRVIHRFSEDVDITIDESLSQGQKKKVKYAVMDIAKELGMHISNLKDTRSRRDYNRYILEYNSILPVINHAVPPAVLLETSFATVSFPTIQLPVSSYVGNMMQTEAPEAVSEYGLLPFEMKVQGIDRTLADKVFAVCDYYLDNRVKRHSRHLYDIYMLLSLVPLDEKFRLLVQDVRRERAKLHICPSAQPDIDIPGLLKEILDKKIYKNDYDNLTVWLLEENADYEVVVRAIEQIIESGVFGSQAAHHRR